MLNRLLDELLLLILSAARSLTTDRIKTDGLLKVLNNNSLAKNAVLEAELELRSYMEGKRAEGAKVPLGLMASSRWDGTESFPVASAYNAVSEERAGVKMRCKQQGLMTTLYALPFFFLCSSGYDVSTILHWAIGKTIAQQVIKTS